MSDLLTELTAKAGGLSPEERASLAVWLLESLETGETLSEDEWEQAWSHEIARRVALLDAGEPTIPAEDVFAKWRERAR